MSNEAVGELRKQAAGYFGKVPGYGDFISKRLPRTFTDQWDQWLQSAVADSREQLGENWLNTYLTSPIWRFALSAGLCDKPAWCGLLMPSVDRVGRYFPLTLAAPMPVNGNLMALLTESKEWFDQGEKLVLSTLEDKFDLDAFDLALNDLGSPDPGREPSLMNPFTTHRPAWQFQLDSLESVDRQLSGFTHSILDMHLQNYSLWWTHGSELIKPSLLLCEGLPPMECWAGLLDGSWVHWGWGRYITRVENDNDE
ncbi:MAG: type VI secretion system-associated protein TagF [Gammaproteobacteria bacterium]|nr:type VI secretion system-associated protein TagF [Gammaproteobacteria bacterium]